MSIETYGSYQLLKRIATGGMAQIFLSRKTGMEGFEKLIVVKRILPHLAENEEFIRMFLDEARIAARLNHPNIVQIFDLGSQDDTFFIAMEYIHGDDVRRVWKKAESVGNPIPVPLVCRIIMDACAGLDYAHKKTDPSGRPLGIVHRDISPQNILVTFEGGVKVVDFGIAKAADQATVTRSGVLKGKYAYMSPEQAQGKSLDCRTDIFALGVVLHELLTGKRLFKRGSDLQTLAAVNECVVSAPSELNPRVPASLDAVVLKALTRDPEQRYAHAVDLQLALENWLLENQQPSSSAHLAAFMREVYADRLAKEAAEGQVLVDETSRGREDEPSPHRSKTPAARPTRGAPRHTVSVAPPDPHAEFTLTDRSGGRRSVSQSTRPTGGKPSVSRGTPIGPPKRNVWLWGAVATVAIVAAGMMGLALLGPLRAAPRATVRLQTLPSGASVSLAGQSIPGRTPLELPSLPKGVYPVTVTKDGFEDHHLELAVPESGELAVPEIVLRPVGGDARPAAPAPVLLVVRTVPPGALIYVDGVDRGRSPIEVKVTARTPVAVRAELGGYDDEQSVIAIGEGPTQEAVFPLTRVAGTARKPPAADKKESRQTGQVRFVAHPWADVECEGQVLGQTPFAPRSMPVGEYECKFSNPELGTVTQRVVVRANEKHVVTVKF